MRCGIENASSFGMSNVTSEEAPLSKQDVNSGKVGIGMGTILIPVLLSTVLSLGVVGGGGYYLIHSGKLGGSSQATAVPVIVVSQVPSHVLALEPMIVNLSDDGAHAYLRASISLRIKDAAKSEAKEEKKEAGAVDPTATELRDTTLAVLSRQTSENLLQPSGRDKLKETLQQEYKQRLTEVSVLDVYFTDFLVQR